MDKRLAIESINLYENIKFTEQIEGEDVIGYIDDYGLHIKVLYKEDNLGKYIALQYTIEKKSNSDSVFEYLSRWIVNGRYKVMEDSILLWSIIPILDIQFLGKQIKHALTEIWDMSNIAKNTPD